MQGSAKFTTTSSIRYWQSSDTGYITGTTFSTTYFVSTCADCRYSYLMLLVLAATAVTHCYCYTVTNHYVQIMAAMGMYVFANCFGYPDLKNMPSCNGDLTEHALLLCMSTSATNKHAEKHVCRPSGTKQCALKNLPPRHPFRLVLSTAAAASSSSAGSSSEQQKQMWYVEPMIRSLAIMESIGGITRLPRVKPVKGEYCSTSTYICYCMMTVNNLQYRCVNDAVCF
jgi:hypothetical protein